MDQFRRLTIHFESAAVHKRGHPRERRWHSLTLTRDQADLVLVDREGPPIVAEGAVPAGAFDRARVEVGEAAGLLRDGSEARIESIVEPIAVPVSLPQGEIATVRLELIILSSPADPPDQFQLFVRDAWVEE